MSEHPNNLFQNYNTSDPQSFYRYQQEIGISQPLHHAPAPIIHATFLGNIEKEMDQDNNEVRVR